MIRKEIGISRVYNPVNPTPNGKNGLKVRIWNMFS